MWRTSAWFTSVECQPEPGAYQLQIFLMNSFYFGNLTVESPLKPLFNFTLFTCTTTDVKVRLIRHCRLKHSTVFLYKIEIDGCRWISRRLLGRLMCTEHVFHECLGGQTRKSVDQVWLSGKIRLDCAGKARTGWILMSQPTLGAPCSNLWKPKLSSSSWFCTASFHFSCWSVPSRSPDWSKTSPSAVRVTEEDPTLAVLPKFPRPLNRADEPLPRLL